MDKQPTPAAKPPKPVLPHWSDKHKAPPAPVAPAGGLSKRWTRAAHQVAPMFGSAYLKS
jgi:hypothetical protein